MAYAEEGERTIIHKQRRGGKEIKPGDWAREK
jgi:hypothetical protein